MGDPFLLRIGRSLDLCQHDCACPEPIASLARRIEYACPENWRLAPSLWRQPLAQAHELVFSPLAGSHVLVLHPEASAFLNRFGGSAASPTSQQMSAQQRNLIEWFSQYELIVPFGSSPISPQSESSVLTTWLHVTNECNLRCDYCYIDKTPDAIEVAP